MIEGCSLLRFYFEPCCLFAGTNGGVSALGTLASAFGGGSVGLAYYLCLLACAPPSLMAGAPSQWRLIPLAALAGVLGSLIDSVLGATLQYSGQRVDTGVVVHHPGNTVRHICGWHLLDNHMVNLLAGALTAQLTPTLAFHLMRQPNS